MGSTRQPPDSGAREGWQVILCAPGAVCCFSSEGGTVPGFRDPPSWRLTNKPVTSKREFVLRRQLERSHPLSDPHHPGEEAKLQKFTNYNRNLWVHWSSSPHESFSYNPSHQVSLSLSLLPLPLCEREIGGLTHILSLFHGCSAFSHSWTQALCGVLLHTSVNFPGRLSRAAIRLLARICSCIQSSWSRLKLLSFQVGRQECVRTRPIQSLCDTGRSQNCHFTWRLRTI
ncbi:Voltage-gated potassium channel subunit beta-2 [Manis javanica]|nr:Voltage-gated potassium channel subunit beta-2 [Manis javanica]